MNMNVANINFYLSIKGSVSRIRYGEEGNEKLKGLKGSGGTRGSNEAKILNSFSTNIKTKAKQKFRYIWR